MPGPDVADFSIDLEFECFDLTFVILAGLLIGD
jgi:hypothetical protein